MACRLKYPKTRRVSHVDVVHGVKVPDSHCWLEDIDSPETLAWIEEQKEVTFGYLKVVPGRERIRKRMTELWDFEKYGIPFKRGTRYFYTLNDGLRNQAVLYWTGGCGVSPGCYWTPTGSARKAPWPSRGWR